VPRFAVLSDVHSNLEALEAVLGEVRGMEVYCLGDMVGYGASPDGVVKILAERGAKCVLGNHDYAVLTGDVSMFNPKAAIAARWTGRKLAPESAEFLKGLPRELVTTIGRTRAYFTHGSPDDTLWEYVDPRSHGDLFGHYLGKKDARMIGLGHTHVPYVWRGREGVVFNPGSVGQPRDGDRRASYAEVEVGKEVKVDVKRVEYDFEKAASKIRAAGLPEVFAERLYSGT
jgi:predicted phosphodiesterase